MKSKLRSFFQNDKNELKSGTHIFQLIINKTKTIFVNKPRINFFPQYTLTNSNVGKKKKIQTEYVQIFKEELQFSFE